MLFTIYNGNSFLPNYSKCRKRYMITRTFVFVNYCKCFKRYMINGTIFSSIIATVVTESVYLYLKKQETKLGDNNLPFLNRRKNIRTYRGTPAELAHFYRRWTPAEFAHFNLNEITTRKLYNEKIIQ